MNVEKELKEISIARKIADWFSFLNPSLLYPANPVYPVYLLKFGAGGMLND